MATLAELERRVMGLEACVGQMTDLLQRTLDKLEARIPAKDDDSPSGQEGGE